MKECCILLFTRLQANVKIVTIVWNEEQGYTYIMKETGGVVMKDKAYTYMLECRDGSLYTGWTNNLEKRVACHNAGKGGKYTASRLPVKLVYYETFETKQEAMRREYAIKQLSRKEKIKLVGNQKSEYELSHF